MEGQIMLNQFRVVIFFDKPCHLIYKTLESTQVLFVCFFIYKREDIQFKRKESTGWVST